MDTFDVACLGDTTQDLFFFIDDASIFCELNSEVCELILRYAQKINVEKFAKSIGGNAANVSVGLKRLGLNVALVTALGNCGSGEWIREELEKERVNLDWVKTDLARDSNISAILVYKGERTILSYHGAGGDRPEKVPPAKWLYVARSPGRNSKELYEEALVIKKADPQVKIAFNPAERDIKIPPENLPNLLKETDLLFVNRDEGMAIIGQKFTHMTQEGISWSEGLQFIAEEVTTYGPKTVAITDGAMGAAVLQGNNYTYKIAKQANVLETTGAGDAFASGFLAATISEKDLPTALSWGITNSASVVTRIGAIAGLLTKNEIS